MVLIEAVRGGGALMKVEAPVIVFDENGEYSRRDTDYLRVLKSACGGKVHDRKIISVCNTHW